MTATRMYRTVIAANRDLSTLKLVKLSRVCVPKAMKIHLVAQQHHQPD